MTIETEVLDWHYCTYCHKSFSTQREFLDHLSGYRLDVEDDRG